MNRIKKIFIIFTILIMFVCSIFVVYAQTGFQNQPQTTSNKIVSLSNNQVNPKTEFYLILNLENIDYTKFKVDITNTSSLKPDELTENVTELSTNNVATTFVVDKNLITLDKLGVVYTSPENEAKINFSVKITNLDETKEDIQNEIDSVDLVIKDLENTLKSLNDILSGIENTTSDLFETTKESIKQATDEINSKNQEKINLQEKLENFSSEVLEEISLDVIKQDENKNNESDKENPFGDKENMLDKDKELMFNKDMQKMKDQMSGLEKDLLNANNKITSLTQGETYKGSQNNYLKSLSINGVEFKNAFKKTTVDYFATLDDDLEKVTVNATPEDSTAIVTIYGNTNLEKGKNKILINVTADNGETRTYRIYLSK